MYRIDNATSVPHASGVPTPAAPGANLNGYFTAGNPGGGVAATIVDADWANATQEEIANVIEGAGITLSKTVRTQLLTAISALANAQRNYQVFTTSGSWTVPAYVTKAKATVVAAGGGSGSVTINQGAGGGGAGGASVGVFAVTPGAVITVTVGAGGAAGVGGNGGNGGTSSFGALCSATGGGGGSTGTASIAAGGFGGVGSGGNFNISGGDGGDGFSGAPSYGGLGGASMFGGGSRMFNGGIAPGLRAVGSGAGAPYGNAGNGLAGAPGVVIVEW